MTQVAENLTGRNPKKRDMVDIINGNAFLFQAFSDGMAGEF
jgi:hypothetical protein